MTPIERACERAMHRMNESINRSAGQHMSAVRKAHAPVIEQVAPVIQAAAPVIELVNTDNMLPDAFVSRMYDEQESDDAMSAMRMLAYAFVALALTGVAVTLAVTIAIFNQP
jgi:hypothetical protein